MCDRNGCKPTRTPPTAKTDAYRPSFTTRENVARADELALAETHDVITGLDQLQAQDVLRNLADSHLDDVRHSLHEEGLMS